MNSYVIMDNEATNVNTFAIGIIRHSFENTKFTIDLKPVMFILWTLIMQR